MTAQLERRVIDWGTPMTLDEINELMNASDNSEICAGEMSLHDACVRIADELDDIIKLTPIVKA